MTEETVRMMFFKNYSSGDLNEALIVAIQEVTIDVIKESTEQPESLPEIVGTIAMGKSHIDLFGRLTDGARPAVPMSYLIYFDQLRKAMIDVVRYTRDNLEALNPWFRERFKKEDLESMSIEMASSIERSGGLPMNVRTFNSSELTLYQEFFNSALIGIIGIEKFQKYAEEYNKCAAVLRQCQTECKSLCGKVRTKES